MKKQLLLSVFVPLLVVVGVRAQSDMLFSLEPTKCPEIVDYALTVPTEIEGETYQCGVLIVPQNYNEPGGTTIELIYLRLFSTGDSPAPDPLLYLSGGPGGDALIEFPSANNMYANLALARQSRDIVTYSQRGTGYSDSILCGPFQGAIGVALDMVSEEMAQAIEQIEGDADAANALLMALCFGGYRSVGVDFTQGV